MTNRDWYVTEYDKIGFTFIDDVGPISISLDRYHESFYLKHQYIIPEQGNNYIFKPISQPMKFSIAALIDFKGRLAKFVVGS